MYIEYPAGYGRHSLKEAKGQKCQYVALKKMGRSIPEIMKNGTRPRGKAKAGGEGEGDGDVGDKTSSWTLSKGLKEEKRK